MSNMASTREAFGEALLELARKRSDVVALAADASTSMCTAVLEEEFPDRCYNIGICEQNMVTMASGLAASGKMPFIASYSTFLSLRCCEQLRTFVAYPNLNVKIVAGLGGISAGIEGVTHLAPEDLGIVRCIPNMTILCPSDALAVKQAVWASADHDGPVYIRIGRDATPIIHPQGYQFKIGQVVKIAEYGKDAAVLVMGFPLYQVLSAAKDLLRENIKVSVFEVHTLKPIDEEAIVEIAKHSRSLVTVEEHSAIGGLGSAVADVLSRSYPIIVHRISLPDRFLESGTPTELSEKYGLGIDAIRGGIRNASAL